ncbi:MAG: hypothetical protein Q9M36_01485 [Sulfurovum sp.]|nr:hypothetical protein [Sulfurovum sp.]
MLEIASQIAICLVIAGIIGFIIGYIVAKTANKKSSTAKTETPTEEKSEETKEVIALKEMPIDLATQEVIDAVKNLDAQEEIKEEAKIEPIEPIEELVLEQVIKQVMTKPQLIESPDTPKDTLSQIKGIGPKLEEKLNLAGIFYFEQIANWNDENIAWLEENTAFAHRAKKDFWVSQAQDLR